MHERKQASNRSSKQTNKQTGAHVHKNHGHCSFASWNQSRGFGDPNFALVLYYAFVVCLCTSMFGCLRQSNRVMVCIRIKITLAYVSLVTLFRDYWSIQHPGSLNLCFLINQPTCPSDITVVVVSKVIPFSSSLSINLSRINYLFIYSVVHSFKRPAHV